MKQLQELLKDGALLTLGGFILLVVGASLIWNLGIGLAVAGIVGFVVGTIMISNN